MYWTKYSKNTPDDIYPYSAVAVDHLIYLFGADPAVGGAFDIQKPINIHIFNTNNFKWSKLADRTDINGVPLKPPEVPFERQDHTVVAYGKKIYLFGGKGRIECNTLYSFDTKTLNWSKPQVTGIIPGPLSFHSSCISNHSMYMFHDYTREIHCLNLKTMNWSCIKNVEETPLYRASYEATIVDNRLYIFGGTEPRPYIGNIEEDEEMEETYYNDIMYLDLNLNRWHRPIVTGDIPVGRTSHSMFVHNNLIYVFGGVNDSDGDLNDLYCFDTKRNHWNLVKPRGKSPKARAMHMCIAVGDEMVIIGGDSETDGVSDETIVLDFNPTLETLAIMAIIENGLDYSDLPTKIKNLLIPYQQMDEFR